MRIADVKVNMIVKYVIYIDYVPTKDAFVRTGQLGSEAPDIIVASGVEMLGELFGKVFPLEVRNRLHVVRKGAEIEKSLVRGEGVHSSGQRIPSL